MSVTLQYSGLEGPTSTFEYSYTTETVIEYNGAVINGSSDPDSFAPESFKFIDGDTSVELLILIDHTIPFTFLVKKYKDGVLVETSDGTDTGLTITITHPVMTSSGGTTGSVTSSTVTCTGVTGFSLTADTQSAAARSDLDSSSGLYDVSHTIFGTLITITSGTESTSVSANYSISDTILGTIFYIQRTADVLDTHLNDIVPPDATIDQLYPPVTAQSAYFFREIDGDSYSPPYTGPTAIPASDGFTSVDLGASTASFVYGFHNIDFEETDHTSTVYVTWMQDIDFTNA